MTQWKIGTKLQREDWEVGIIAAEVIKTEQIGSQHYVTIRTAKGFEASSPQQFFEGRDWQVQ